VSVVFDRHLDRLGSHRVIEPAGSLPQNAHKIDNTPIAFENEILCDVETLNIDSASFRQIGEVCGGDKDQIAKHILATVKERGKQHNPVTGSGGMFVGRVLKVGEHLRGKIGIQAGDRIASLVSLTLTPLMLEAITEIDVATGRIWVRGKAVLFESGLWAKLPGDIETDVALATLDVAGAPAHVRRMTQPGHSVVVIGADGKSGMLSCVQAKARSGPEGVVIGLVPDASTEASKLLLEDKIVDCLIEVDARDAVAVNQKIAQALPGLADLTVNCVNCPGTELSSILCTKEQGVVYFFSMSTSFTSAALGAEGVGKDVTMIVGNGYAKGHADMALQTLRDYPHIHAYFRKRYASLKGT